MVSDSAARGAAMLEERLARVPDQIAATLAGPPMPRATSASRWLVTGVGASEGPARLLVSALADSGALARYAPLSAFASGRAPEADVCVVFSQSLSPNARLAFSARERFSQVWAVTSVDPGGALAAALERRRVRLIAHGPSEETGLLLRVVGAAAAGVVALRIAAECLASRPPWSHELSRLASRVRAVVSPDAPLHARLVLVGSAADASAYEGLRLKLVEGLGVAATLTDVCALAHGPLQSFWDEPTTVVSLEHEADPCAELFERLVSTLRPHHQLLRLRAAAPAPVSYLEHAAMLDRLILAGLRVRPRDLCEWPGKGHDAMLYDVGRDALEDE